MIKKKNKIQFIFSLTLSLFSLFCMTMNLGAAEYEFKFHHFLPKTSPAHISMIEPWVKKVEEDSAGRIKIDIYPSMTLGGRPADLVSQARNGVVDLIWTSNGYTPGQFPRTELFELPLIHTNDPEKTGAVMHEMFSEYLEEDYSGLKVLFLHVHAGNVFQSVQKEISDINSFKGMKVRTPSRTGSWILDELGSEAISVPMPDVVQTLSKNMIDAALIPYEIIPTFKLNEYTKYQVEGYDGFRFGTLTFQVSMNKEKWDNLPNEIKEIFQANSNLSQWKNAGKIWQMNDNDGLDYALRNGNIHKILGYNETEGIKNKLKGTHDIWLRELSKENIDGAPILEKAMQLMGE
jgi:TRAP-type C4-dicarboxylate transport system substrate-binding protein